MNVRQKLAVMFGVGLPLLILMVIAVVNYLLWPLTGVHWLLLILFALGVGWLLVWQVNKLLAQTQPRPVNGMDAPAPVDISAGTKLAPGKLVQPAVTTAPGLPAVAPIAGKSEAPARPDFGEPDEWLRSNDHIYHKLVAHAPSGIAVLDQTGKLYFINPTGAELLEMNPEEQPAPMSLLEIVPPADRQKISQWLARINSGNAVGPLEQVTRSGRTVKIVSAPLVLDATPFIQLIMADISQQKDREAEFAAQNRTLTTFQSAGVAITSRLDLRYVLDTVAHEMTKLIGVERCIIFQWDL